MTGSGLIVVCLAAIAGGLGAVAVREAVAVSPAAGSWVAAAVEPLRRAGREGYVPTEVERRRLSILGALAMLAGGVVIFGPGPAPLAAAAGPAVAASAIARRRASYRRAVDRGLPEVATAIADALAAGRSARAALIAAAQKVEHYEIACYGCAATYADLLGEEAAARQLRSKWRRRGRP